MNGKNGLKGSHKSNCTWLVFSQLAELEMLGIFHLVGGHWHDSKG